MTRIGYFPYHVTTNSYATEMHRLFGEFGHVVAQPTWSSFFTERWFSYDLVVLNWTENNFIHPGVGRISWLGVFKEFCRLALLRLMSKRLLFVRHNVHPHHTAPSSRKLATWLIDRYEQFFDMAWVHSGHAAGGRRRYFPHPIYDLPAADCSRISIVPFSDYFLVFGRILPYKRIIDLLATLPKGVNIVIAGPCSDDEYLNLLRRQATVTTYIVPEFVPDETAADLVRGATATLICHAEADMIASGSILYSLSAGTPVLAVRSGFSLWLEGRLGSSAVKTFPDTKSLAAELVSYQRSTKAMNAAVIRDEFSFSKCKDYAAEYLQELGIACPLSRRRPST